MNDDFQTVWTEQPATLDDCRPLAGSAGHGAVKQIVTIRLDVDMLNWLKSAGPGYQTRINQVLRKHMAEERARAEDRALKLK